MNWFKRFFLLAGRHKIISVVVIVAVAGGGYYWYSSVNKTAGKVSYVTSVVSKNTIVVSVSGSGQVSASNQIDIKSKVSENVIYVGVVGGQQVKRGTLLMEFDTTNAQKAVRNATLSVDNANLSFEKLAGGSDLAVPLNKQRAQDKLVQDYSDGFNAVSNTFLDLPPVMTGLDSILLGSDLNKNSQNISYYRDYINLYSDKGSQYATNAQSAYQKALGAYNKNFDDYKSISRLSDTQAISAMIQETYDTTQSISDAIKNITNLIQFYKDVYTAQGLTPNPLADTQLSNLNSYTGKTDADLSSLLNIKATIKTDTDAIANSDLDIKSENVSVEQAQNALADAKDNLASCYIYAPFDGIVANVDYVKGDAASSGSTAITFITNQSITQIPFNEVDITKIKAGQKATLVFDAIDGLTIAGQVAQIDTLGTVTQGVVNYNVKVVFDASGTEVKPGMSVTANIIIQAKPDVLTVPNSAVKSSGGVQYVQVLENGLPVRKPVQTGLSNDTDTEIISGLFEGQTVITQTVTTTASTTSSSTASSLRIPGLTGGAGSGGFGGGARASGAAAGR